MQGKIYQKKINQKYKIRKQLKNTIVPAKEIIGMTNQQKDIISKLDEEKKKIIKDRYKTLALTKEQAEIL